MKGTNRRVALVTVALAAMTLALTAVATAGGSSTSDVVHATAKYRDVAIAKRAGFGLLKDKKGIACIAMDDMPGMGAMGFHYVKSARVGDGRIAATAPEALVYAPAANGKLRLAAVEYVVLKAAWDAHHSSAPSLFGHRFNFTPAGNRFGLPAYYSLHAWLFQPNPSGEFSMWNPKVSCTKKGG
jgi:hypothetical protein